MYIFLLRPFSINLYRFQCNIPQLFFVYRSNETEIKIYASYGTLKLLRLSFFVSFAAVVTILLKDPNTGASFVKTATVMKKGMSFGVSENIQ